MWLIFRQVQTLSWKTFQMICCFNIMRGSDVYWLSHRTSYNRLVYITTEARALITHSHSCITLKHLCIWLHLPFAYMHWYYYDTSGWYAVKLERYYQTINAGIIISVSIFCSDAVEEVIHFVQIPQTMHSFWLRNCKLILFYYANFTKSYIIFILKNSPNFDQKKILCIDQNFILNVWTNSDCAIHSFIPTDAYFCQTNLCKWLLLNCAQ